jgi:hypothetical protein
MQLSKFVDGTRLAAAGTLNDGHISGTLNIPFHPVDGTKHQLVDRADELGVPGFFSC